MSEELPNSMEVTLDATAPVAPGLAADDNSFDLSLRLLTWLVMIALAASVSLLVYRWIAPRLEEANARPAPAMAPSPAPPSTVAAPGAQHRDEVLMDPGRVFKCEEQGRVTFSDQACVNGGGSAAGTAPPRAPPPGHN